MFKFKKTPFRYRILKFMGDNPDIQFSFDRLLEKFSQVNYDDMDQHVCLLQRDEFIVAIKEKIKNPYKEVLPETGKFIQVSNYQISDKGLRLLHEKREARRTRKF